MTLDASFLADHLEKDRLSQSAQVTPYGDGFDVLLPFDLHDGETLIAHVQELSPDTYRVSDMGQLSHSLSLSGVDLNKSNVKRSWQMIRQLLGAEATHPSAPDVDDEWELSLTTAGPNIARAIHTLTESMLRADGLVALARVPQQQLKFAAQLMRDANARGLAVVPNAQLLTSSGMRRNVAFSAKGTGRRVFVQAVGDDQDVTRSYDHTYAVFGDAAVHRDRRIAVLAETLKDKPYTKGLSQVSTVIFESDADDLWDSLKAA